jgi:hypothetical protein
VVRRLLGLTVAAAIALSACASVTSSSIAPASAPVFPSISVANGTTISVAIAVNGTVMETVAPGTTEDPIPATLPARPWTVEARSPTGRVLATMTVGATDDITSTSGRFARADLACGRLDVWSGPPVLGPTFIPDASKPCD